jgi:hypothetical protein
MEVLIMSTNTERFLSDVELDSVTGGGYTNPAGRPMSTDAVGTCIKGNKVNMKQFVIGSDGFSGAWQGSSTYITDGCYNCKIFETGTRGDCQITFHSPTNNMR